MLVGGRYRIFRTQGIKRGIEEAIVVWGTGGLWLLVVGAVLEALAC
jgi:hypothetical protein